jgi:hypothetical protein
VKSACASWQLVVWFIETTCSHSALLELSEIWSQHRLNVVQSPASLELLQAPSTARTPITPMPKNRFMTKTSIAALSPTGAFVALREGAACHPIDGRSRIASRRVRPRLTQEERNDSHRLALLWGEGRG